MSRIGKKPIQIPKGVDVHITGQKVVVKGPKGELQRELSSEIKIEIKDGEVVTSPQTETKNTNAFWGLTRALLANMIIGVTEGYERKLSIEGIGFKVVMEGSNLALHVGLSHYVPFVAPEGVTLSAEKNIITVSGIDKALVTQTAANIRKIKPPEPYKGKGIRYIDEVVRRKLGKRSAVGE